MKDICHDFDNICGEMAKRLASLFAFLKPASSGTKHSDPMGLSLYADPGYWLYGLLSFCAKACESKTAEANGTPALRARDERGTPALEATGKTLALMQTVVMSFGRNQSLGKPDLPIHHLHVYFPVQLVHKLVERMDRLQFTDVTPEDGKKYRHNGESKTNSPYIVVGTYEGVCPSSTFSALPDTPRLAGAYEYGILDGNLRQMVSFQSTYKSTLRIEVPVWPEVQQGVLTTNKAKRHPGSPKITSPFPPVGNNIQGAVSGPHTQANTTTVPDGAGDIEDEEEEEEDDTYVPLEGQGCFSFRQSLLLRAKDTYAARSNGNKYEIISEWLLTGLAVVLSRPNWHILAKRCTLTSTPRELLRLYYQQGHPADLANKAKLPYALPWHNAVLDAEWQHTVERFSHAKYLQDMETVNTERTRSGIDAFYTTMNQTNPIKAAQEETEPANSPAEQTMAAASTSSGLCPADKPIIASAV